MRNLVLLQEKRHAVANVVDLCHIDDGIQESSVVLTNDGSLIAQRWQQQLNGDCRNWFQVTFVDPQIVCLSRSGAIVSVQPETGDQELVGAFDHGIIDGKWSPDAEVLALVTLTENDDGTTNGVLLTMTAEFEVLNEIVLEKFDENSQVSLSWRPDGTLLALNTLETLDNIRRIRTYKRDSLALHSVGLSEDGSGKLVPNLHPPLSWASSGCSNLIASVQRKTKRTQLVVFFEPNGLRHREFDLRSLATVKCLCWNALSDLLAVSLEDDDGSSRLQLWHRSNYHWYLKYEWKFESQIVCTVFHEEQPYRLFLGLTHEWREYTCCWDVSTYSVISNDGFTAFSIDGAILKSTPLHKALVPPPMYANSITLTHAVRQVVFFGELVVLYLSNGCLCTVDSIIPRPMVPWETTLEVDVHALRHLVGVKSNDSTLELIAVAFDNRLVEIQLDLEKNVASITNTIPMEGSVLKIVNWSDCANGALIELDDGELLEYLDGHVVPSSLEPLLEPCPWIAALYHAADMDAEPEHPHRERLVVGQSARSRLYCHDRLLADSVSSFILSTAHQFVCFVTAGAHCQLRSLALTSLHNFDPLMGSDEQDSDGYEPRNVERGARLVAVLPNQPTVVLQMPRGNLEGIFPRSLVLPYVMTKINSGDFGIAFTMMRRHKVDLNLIVDLDCAKFLADGVVKFIEDVKPVDFLNLFISTLQNADVTRDRYILPSWFHRTSSTSIADDFDVTTKVNQVCQRVRAVLTEAEERGTTCGGRTVADGYYLLPILSTYAKEDPPKLEQALSMIRDKAIAQHSASNKKPPLLSEKAQSSIQYLAFLADYKLLFETALGMYDYELARAVARNSQMDPKIYLPLLKRLNSLPEYFSKYEVDIRLKRYETALSNLYTSGIQKENLDAFEATEGQVFGNGFDQCLELIEKHGLHRLGLQLYKYDTEREHLLLRSLGENLLQQGKAKAALSIFLSADPMDLDGAKRAARLCGDWRYYFTLSTETLASAPAEAQEIRRRQVANEIAQEIAAGRGGVGNNTRDALADAARILIDYGSDIVGAVDILNSAEMWAEARRLAILHDRNDLVKKTVDAAVSYADGMMSDFEEKKIRFEKTSQRYVEVLRIRKDAIAEAGGLEAGDALDQGDDAGSLFSLASTSSLRSTASAGSMGSVRSVASVSTVITVGQQSTFTMNSEHDRERHKSKFNSIGKKEKKKSKRKGPKKNKLRPGSEEELKFLVDTLKNCCVDINYTAIIDETAFFLSQVGHMELARQLYESYESLRNAVNAIQTDRQKTDAVERMDMARNARMAGNTNPAITLPCESVVNALQCETLSTVLTDLFSYF
ncbi:IKI3 family [Fragilaria crotonensis]|nr:IKI3 family [Fragilaria crotonensis]